MGQAGKVARLPVVALLIALSGSAPAVAQDAGTATPAPSSARPLDFRLPPADDGRAPGVQGPSDNGLPPVAPGERRGAQPAPTPTPSPSPTPSPVQPVTPPRVTATQPAATQPAAASTAAPSPTGRAAPGATPGQPAAGSVPPAGSALPPLATETPNIVAPTVAAPAASAASDEAAGAARSASAPAGTPLWAWLLAVLAALGIGAWYWRRRAALAGSAVDPEWDTPRPAAPVAAPRAAMPPATPAAPAPRSAPVAAPRAVPLDAPRPASPLVTRAAGDQRALVGMTLDIRSIRFAADHVAVGFALHLINQGSLPATGLMVRIALNQGSAMPEPVLSRFFDGAGGSVLRDDMVLAVGAGEELATEVMLPRASIAPLMIGGKPMLVPVIAFDVTYHWDGEGEAFGQNAASFVLGRAAAPGGGDKLAPLPLDRAAYLVDRPGARATAIKRSQ